MSIRNDEIEDVQIRAQAEFTRKVLDRPYDLTHDEFVDARYNLSEIIFTATRTLGMPDDELAQKLVLLRNHAEHNCVEIKLPTEITETATRLARWKPPQKPDEQVREVDREGLLRMLGHGTARS